MCYLGVTIFIRQHQGGGGAGGWGGGYITGSMEMQSPCGCRGMVH